MSAPSIVQRVTRVYVLGVALAALSIAVMSALSLTAVFVVRDDHDALALGHLLATELEDHADQPGSHDRVVRHELGEQVWFGREIEVWRGSDRIGGDESSGVLRSYADAGPGCRLGRVHGAPSRLCVVRAATDDEVVVATELGPMLEAMVPMLVAIALVSALVALSFGAMGRRVIARGLSPLSRFEAHVAGIAVPRASLHEPRPRVPTSWSAAEIDSLAATFGELVTRFDDAMVREHRFVSDAAHELRTPLTRLRAQLELAREEAREGRPVDARLIAAIRASTELTDACEALLAMARDTSGPTEPVDLGDVVDACIAKLAPDEQARVRIEREGDAVTEGAEPLLALAVSNLVENALRYTEGPVSVRVGGDEDRLALSVEDEGPGIPEHELARVREPFVRGSGARARGTGLGLALVDHVATLHGGALMLANRAPSGLSATLALRPWRSRDGS